MKKVLKIVGVFFGGVALLLLAGYAFREFSEAQNLKKFPAPGILVDIGGRSLHIRCRGTAPGPTVIIETGSGSPSIVFWGVQDAVVTFARVCTYDRAGYGWSDLPPPDQTMQDRVTDLHALLENAGEAGPYVLAGHSYGGMLIRLFKQTYPDEVAGVVLIDAAEEGGYWTPDWEKQVGVMKGVMPLLRFAGSVGLAPVIASILQSEEPAEWPPEAVVALRADIIDRISEEGFSLEHVAPDMRRFGAFGVLDDLPTVVVSRGRRLEGATIVSEDAWQEGQKRLLSLSTDSVQVIATESGHNIQYFQPEIVVDAIRRVHTAVMERDRVSAP